MPKTTPRGTLNSIVKEISEVARYLWERGWAESSAGNLSVDVTDLAPNNYLVKGRSTIFPEGKYYKALAGHTLLITAAGSRFRDLARAPEENLLLIRIAENLRSGQIHKGGKEIVNKPTSELTTHLRIHEFLTENKLPHKAILHTHPPHLIALTHLESYRTEDAVNRLLQKMLPEVQIVLPEGVGLAPYRSPGSTSLAGRTVRSLRHHRVVLWEKHGCIAIGENAVEAFDLIDTVNKGAEIFFLVQRVSESSTKRKR